jgi:hypothetical protein
MSSLNEIAIKHGTDKSSEIHNYCEKYERYLPFKSSDNLKILEIGILRGVSLTTWKEYFYNSKIVGLDIDEKCKQYENIQNNIHVEIGSQEDEIFLGSVVGKYGMFDMILDDGSHMNEHVITSFELLFPFLKSGGVYAVEDSCTSYWQKWNGGYLKNTSMIEYFKRLSDDVNFRGLENNNGKFRYARREDWLIEQSKISQPDCRVDIESITFLNSIILIRKR